MCIGESSNNNLTLIALHNRDLAPIRVDRHRHRDEGATTVALKILDINHLYEDDTINEQRPQRKYQQGDIQNDRLLHQSHHPGDIHQVIVFTNTKHPKTNNLIP